MSERFVKILGASLLDDFPCSSTCRPPRSRCSHPSDFAVVGAWYGEEKEAVKPVKAVRDAGDGEVNFGLQLAEEVHVPASLPQRG